MSDGEWRGETGIEHACNFLEPLSSKQEEKNRDDGRRLCPKIIGTGNVLTLHVRAPETSSPPPIKKTWHGGTSMTFSAGKAETERSQRLTGQTV